MSFHKITIKTPEEIEIMKEGGAILARVKARCREAVKVGATAMDVEKVAVKAIADEGAEASFKKVEDYSWATCINKNEGIVHGIPSDEVVFEEGDLVSVDVGVFYKGFHTDTSISVSLSTDPKVNKFLKAGEIALKEAIEAAQPGNRVFDISLAIEDAITKAGYKPVLALTGHGVGRELHEEPMIQCYVRGSRLGSPELVPGMVIAIEVMYVMGKPDLATARDGWTISTRDGKISGLLEETVAITEHGPLVLTEG
jgi:methionyl aminopeptidase